MIRDPSRFNGVKADLWVYFQLGHSVSACAHVDQNEAHKRLASSALGPHKGEGIKTGPAGHRASGRAGPTAIGPAAPPALSVDARRDRPSFLLRELAG
jgi:hypothetical protein